MQTPPSMQRLWKKIRKAHGARSGLLLCIIFVILLATFLRTKPYSALAAGGGSSSSSLPSYSRSCSSQRTIFNRVWNIKNLEKTFQDALSPVFEERLTLLKTPSKWVCPTSLEQAYSLPMPELHSLANSLPGWAYEYRLPLFGGITLFTQEKPVRFENFASIISEFRREYECRISELEADVDKAFSHNLDLDPFSAGFCCSRDNSCIPADRASACSGPLTMDPKCGGACKVYIEHPDLLARRESFLFRLQESKTRARVSIDRAMLTMRSFEMNYAYARSLLCYARASLDLRNELNLLAESISCMPKIWNAVTSLHDRKE